MKKISECKTIKYRTIPNVLFLGNGINRAYNEDSWDDLLRKITKIEIDDTKIKLLSNQIPSPLQAVAVTRDNVKEGIEKYINDESDPKHGNQVALSDNQEKLDTYRSIICKGFDAVLTTNYTYEIEQAVNPDFLCKYNARSKYRKTTYKGNTVDEQFGLFKYMDVSDEKAACPIWHVHGELARPNSMVLGHDYYSKLLARIQSYLKQFNSAYFRSSKNKADYIPKSWVDYFLLGNLYFVGYGLDTAEMDIWRLISCKKHLGLNSAKVYYFDSNLEQDDKFGKRLLLEAYGVEPIPYKVDKDKYQYYYKKVEKKISELMDLNRM